MAENDTLSRRQRRFVAALLVAPTIEEAARAAGIAERTAYRYLKDPAVRAEIRRRLDQATTLATVALTGLASDAVTALCETLSVLSDQVSASFSDFIQVQDDGTWSLDLRKAKESGRLHLIKKLWIDAAEQDRLELHDPQSAAAKLGRLALGILAERRKAAELDDLVERVAALEEAMEHDKFD